MLFELAVEPLETLRIGHRLRVATRGILRSLAEFVELVLRSSRLSVDLDLRRERLLELCAGRCGENDRC